MQQSMPVVARHVRGHEGSAALHTALLLLEWWLREAAMLAGIGILSRQLVCGWHLGAVRCPSRRLRAQPASGVEVRLGFNKRALGCTGCVAQLFITCSSAAGASVTL